MWDEVQPQSKGRSAYSCIYIYYILYHLFAFVCRWAMQLQCLLCHSCCIVSVFLHLFLLCALYVYWDFFAFIRVFIFMRIKVNRKKTSSNPQNRHLYIYLSYICIRLAINCRPAGENLLCKASTKSGASLAVTPIAYAYNCTYLPRSLGANYTSQLSAPIRESARASM